MSLQTSGAHYGASTVWLAQLQLASLSARAGPDGAEAEVGVLSIAAAGVGGDVEGDRASLLLGAEVRSEAGAESDAPQSRNSASDTRERGLADARERGLGRIRGHMRRMAHALLHLQGGRKGSGVAIYSGVASGATASSGSQLAAAGSSSGDALSIRAGQVAALYTGAGHDALTLDAQRVQNIHTDGGAPSSQGGNDALAVRAEQVRQVYTGGGNDAVSIAALSIASLYTGTGEDVVTLKAGLLGGIYTGAGRDAVSIDAVVGAAQVSRLSADPCEPWSHGDTIEARLLAARSAVADVHSGAGDDVLSVTVAEAIALEAGAGDDTLVLGGGTIALRYGAGDGHDTVTLAPGSEVVVQLGEDAQDWSFSRDGDSLLLQIGSGSIRFEGVSQSAAIGVASWGADELALLHSQPELDALA
ncbi:hypothetical protein [Salipiger sp. PrR002]|uniref:hypothetical protein n=1 Tax=Salipiger sp. PrR002 TaxID=2706489 RepID=UPI0013BA107E|nr:hypothetical protein [Salipiger sp. PrR002]NDV98860.1 hypothetical protein [Salipiger sp. PrR002]NDW55597.1 hypothetical protein [Salipiger sp. PrR004]